MKRNLIRYFLLLIATSFLYHCGDSLSSENDSSSSNTTPSSSSIAINDSVDIESGGSYSEVGVMYRLRGGTYNSAITFGENCRVRLTGAVYMEGEDLSFGPGCVVYVPEGDYIEIQEGANIIAEGTEDSPIFFVPLEEGIHWGYDVGERQYACGICIDDDAGAQNAFEWVIFDAATTAIYTEQQQSLSLKNVTLKNNLYYGLHIKDQGSLKNDGMENCAFSNNEEYDVLAQADQLQSFDNENSFSKGVEIDHTDGMADATIPKIGVPYIVPKPIKMYNENAAALLTIEAGVEMQFAQNAYIEIDDNSRLHIAGTEDDSVWLHGLTADVSWGYENGATYSGAIFFEGNALKNNIIEYTIIENTTSAITTEVADAVSIRHNRIQGTEFYGINFRNNSSGTETSVISNVFTDMGIYDAHTPSNGAAAFAANNRFEKGIHLPESEPLTRTVTLDSLGVPYVVMDILHVCNEDIPIELTINSGAEFLFAADAYMEIDCGATLTVNGTEESPVTFAALSTGNPWGYSSGANYSGGIYFEGGASNSSVIEGAVIDEALSGIAIDNGGTIALRNSTITNSTYYAVLRKDGDLSENTDNTFIDNTMGDLSPIN